MQNENEVVYLYLDDIIPNRFQPRQVFDERALKELAVSIKEHGVIQPIIVRNIGNKYEIIAGERRYKASALAGLTKIPAIVRDLDDKESSKVALLENLQRKNLNPMEEARTYQKILELDQMTQEELAKTMGKSQSAIANKLRLLSLTDEVQDALLKEQISERHARSLLALETPEEQTEMLKKVISNKMTVRELEETINPKKEATVGELDDLLKSNPVPIEEKEVAEMNPSNNVNSEFNQSVGIDYSSPPKFIDYGTDDKTPSVVDSSLESTASNPINLDELRANASDINLDTSKNSFDLNNMLKTDNNSDNEGDNNHDSNAGTSGGMFKFFEPAKEESQEDVEVKQDNKMELPSTSSFDLPNVIKTEDNTPKQEEPSAFDALLATSDKQEDSSLDSLLQTNNEGQEEKNENETNNIPYLDTYNNPFARNPIFQDDVEKIVGKGQADGTVKPTYNFNECLELVRNAVKDIESSGFKVDSEEMNFEKNYQIVIKIEKKEEEGK